MKKLLFMVSLAIFFAAGLAILPATTHAESLSSKLSGRVLLDVQAHGETWYVNPANQQRYFLGKPSDALNLMQQLGLGITNNNFESFNGTAPARLSGRILIKVEDSGKAYYVNPVDLKLSYLAEPIAALNVLRSFGLGVMNADLGKITIADSASVNITSSGFNPHNLTVKRGAMVVWTNYDSVVHTVTSPKNFDFGDIKPGKTYSRMFNIVGTYNYYCSYHHNLTGTITVK